MQNQVFLVGVCVIVGFLVWIWWGERKGKK